MTFLFDLLGALCLCLLSLAFAAFAPEKFETLTDKGKAKLAAIKARILAFAERLRARRS